MTVSERDARIIRDCQDTDEPTIAFRAQDKLLPALLIYYRGRAIEEGASEDFIAAVDRRYAEVIAWQMENPIKTPDLRPGEATS